MIKERPILFSTEMVKAIVEGRKTLTRRVIKNKEYLSMLNSGFTPDNIEHPEEDTYCPFGLKKDRLWVRETFKYEYSHGVGESGEELESLNISYKAPGPKWPATYPGDDIVIPDRSGYTPSIFMPLWASRLKLEIINVRVQRLKEISESDAIKEGIEPLPSKRGFYNPMGGGHGSVHLGYYETAKNAFADLWDKINFKRGFGWEKDPWVWVIEFKRVEENS